MRIDVIYDDAVDVATTDLVNVRTFGGFSHDGKDARASGDAGFR